MTPVLYYFAPSGPCRIVISVVRYLGLEIEIRNVDLFKKEQLNADFLKVNPQHTVPVLDDNGFILTESQAIIIYLIEKFFPGGHSLYPKYAKQRARINQQLQFDCGILTPRFRAITYRAIYFGKTDILDDHRQMLFESLETLNKFLDDKKYITGSEQPTLADTTLFTTVANISKLGGDLSRYPNIVSWFETCKKFEGSSENLDGAETLANAVNAILKERL